MKIHNIPYSRITLPGLNALGGRMVETINEKHPAESFFAKSMTKTQAAIEQAVLAVGSSEGSQKTLDVRQADVWRSKSYVSLRNHLDGGRERHNEAYSEAAHRLYAIFKQNNLALARLAQGNKTSALMSLFKDLDNAPSIADLATVNATAWLQELKDDQALFEEAINSRSQEKNDRNVLSDTEAARILTEAMRGLTKTIEVAYDNEMVTDVGDTISLLNTIIDEEVPKYRR